MDSEERDQRNKEHLNERGEKYEKTTKDKSERGIRRDLPKEKRKDEDLDREFSPRGDSSTDPNEQDDDTNRGDSEFIDPDTDDVDYPDTDDEDYY